MDFSVLLTYAGTILKKEQIKTDELMSKHTSFQIGGPAGIFLEIRTEEELEAMIRYMSREEIPFFVLGKGSNVLVSDDGIKAVILSLGGEFCGISIEGNKLKAGAAASLEEISGKAMENGLAGLEFAARIPGSLGGGMVMNAGAYGGEMSQVVTRACAMTRKGERLILEKEQMKLGYRSSIFKEEQYIVLWAEMELEEDDPKEILSKMNDYNEQRSQKQPLEYPSAGSTFKRPQGYFAGKLIMDAGLRGFRVGGAQVSEKHCGFVINRENATAADVKRLMAEVQKQVREQFGVELEPEVIFLGEES